nr:EOG090X03A4 [Lepidurus arcticus]
MSCKFPSRVPWLLLLALGLSFVGFLSGHSPQKPFGFSPIKKSTNGAGDHCFCDLKGKVDDCDCSVDHVDGLNNAKIYPMLRSLMAKDYFRFFKVNLRKPCPFWPDDDRCSMHACAVSPCSEDQIPEGIKSNRTPDASPRPIVSIANTSAFNIIYGPELPPKSSSGSCDNKEDLGTLNTTISESASKGIAKWTAHDQEQDSFCEPDDLDGEGAVYVDLLLNPERYTGYSGPSAHRIWRAIYEENCFKPKRGYGPYIDSTNVGDLCLEKRVFYRAVSGLHTSINIHLCAEYLHLQEGAQLLGPSSGIWAPNVDEFRKRFDPALTSGEGPQRLRNLYFLYLVELRALAKAAPYLLEEPFYTGREEEDKEVRMAVRQFLRNVQDFGPHFNESSMFSDGNKQAKKLKEEFQHHFRNISRIMDCVGCEKCKVWGKLQIQGLGTALKILFSGDFARDDPLSFDLKSMRKSRFRLQRNEIVALFNAFARLSDSIYELENFKMTTSAESWE